MKRKRNHKCFTHPDAMLEKSRSTAEFFGYKNIEFREGFAEDLPVEQLSGPDSMVVGIKHVPPTKPISSLDRSRMS